VSQSAKKIKKATRRSLHPFINDKNVNAPAKDVPKHSLRFKYSPGTRYHDVRAMTMASTMGVAAMSAALALQDAHGLGRD
jgi:hypothetical protein